MRYKRLKILLALLFGLGAVQMYGQQQIKPETKESTTSNVHFFASNYGLFGSDVQNAKSGFTVPRNSDKAYLFGSGLWIGAKKQVTHDGGTTYEEAKLSFITYNPNSGNSWGSPGEYPGGMGSSNPILYHSTDYDRSSGESHVIGSIDPKWPLWLMPQEKTNPFYAGTFVPFDNDRKGDGNPYQRPAFMTGVDEEFFSRYHDGDLSRYEMVTTQAQSLGYPIGLQVQEHIYAWNPGRINENVVVLQYEITNASKDVLRDCYIAQAIDFDIGNAMNDHMKFYDVAPGLRTGIAWSEPEAIDYGTLAMVMLESPAIGANGFIDNSQRGSNASPVGVFRDWTASLDPRTPEGRYDFMADAVLDGDNGPGDKRALMGTGKFNMAPGDKAYYTFAFVVIPDLNPATVKDVKGDAPQGGTLTKLEATVAGLMDQYYEYGFANDVAGVDDQGTSTLSASLWPNPTTDNAILHLALARKSDVRIRVIDNLGRTVSSEKLTDVEAGTFSHSLNLSGVETGSYLVSVEAGAEHHSLNLTVVR